MTRLKAESCPVVWESIWVMGRLLLSSTEYEIDFDSICCTKENTVDLLVRWMAETSEILQSGPVAGSFSRLFGTDVRLALVAPA
jgi:hypothetical protein